MIDGQEAFLLWDTFGFPLDLTQLMAEEAGLSVDVRGFEAAMDEAREKSRGASKRAAVSGGAANEAVNICKYSGWRAVVVISPSCDRLQGRLYSTVLSSPAV